MVYPKYLFGTSHNRCLPSIISKNKNQKRRGSSGKWKSILSCRSNKWCSVIKLELRKGRTKQDKGAYDRTNYECLSTKIRNHRRKSISRIGISNIWSIALPYSSLENLGTKFILHDSKNRKKIFNKLHSTLNVIRFQTSTIHLRNNIMLYT